MNPQLLIKGCGNFVFIDSNIKCGYKLNLFVYYCSICKARMEQALFMIASYENNGDSFIALSKQVKDIVILEKALNIHSPRGSQPGARAKGFPDDTDINNQGVKE